MPTVDLSRTYYADFRNWKGGESRDDLMEARQVIAHAIGSELEYPGVRLECIVAQDGAGAALTVATTVEVDSVPDIDVSKVRVGSRTLDDALAWVDGAIKDLVYRLSVWEEEQREHENTSVESTSKLSTFMAGFTNHIYTNQADSIFRLGRASVSDSSVEFELDPALTRSLRRQEAIESYVVAAFRRYHHDGVVVDIPFRFETAVDRKTQRMMISTIGEGAESLAEAIVARAQRPAGSDVPWGNTLVWGVGALAVTAVTLLVAPMDASSNALASYLAAVTAILVVTVWRASRRTESILRAAVGVVPIAIVVGFAFVYARMMLGSGAQIHGAGDAEIVDAVLLSLGIASTNGVVSFEIDGAGARWAVLLEMLMVATVVGASLVAALRAAASLLLRPRAADDRSNDG